MPPLAAIIPFIVANAATIAAVGAGVGGAASLAELGENLANKGGGTSTGQTQAAAKAAQAAQQKTAFLAAQPQVQSNTSGSLTPSAFNAASANAAGVPNTDLNALISSLGGGGGSSPSQAQVSGGITPSSTQQKDPNDLAGLTDLLKG